MQHRAHESPDDRSAAILASTLDLLAVEENNHEILSGAVDPCPSRKSAVEQIPNEIWDIIIGDDPRGSIFTQRHRITWSLVCREWRSIALAHLFRSIRIHTPTRDVAAYCLFLRERPWIAKVVRHVHVGQLPVDVADLGDLLGVVTDIEGLEIHQVSLESSDPSGPPVGLTRSFILPRLLYRDYNRDVDSVYNQFTQFLELFSDIQELELAMEASSVVVPEHFITSAVQQTAPGRLKVHSLVQPQARTSMDSFVPTFLDSIGALTHLTRLDFEVEHSNQAMARFGQVLLHVGRGLKRLGIIVRRIVLRGDAERNEGFLANGLGACSELEVLTVEIDPSVYKDDMQGVEARNDEWVAATRLISLIPGRHIHSMILEVKFFMRLNVRLLVHAWPWYSMQEALRRFDNLRSLTVNVVVNFGAFSQHWECAEYELREFGGILGTSWPTKCSNSECTCSHSECRKFNAERNAGSGSRDILVIGLFKYHPKIRSIPVDPMWRQ